MGMQEDPMSDVQQVVRELARKALLACEGNWHTAEQLCHQWLAADPTLKEEVIRACLELVIRHAVATESRRLQQQEANQLREMREAQDRQQEITQTVEEFLQDLRRDSHEEAP
jgi:hypothetical protein